jgi:hypothetical protein
MSIEDSVTYLDIPDAIHNEIVDELEDEGVNDPDLVVDIVAGAIARALSDGTLVATRTQAAPNRPVQHGLEAPPPVDPGDPWRRGVGGLVVRGVVNDGAPVVAGQWGGTGFGYGTRSMREAAGAILAACAEADAMAARRGEA